MKTTNLMPAVHIEPPRTFQPPPLHDAIQIQEAEYWLKLGEADLALRELESLPATWNHRSVDKVRVAAIGMLRERREVSA